jgi:MoxR-like ATPase
LNNLLENRELPLDDGSILVPPDVYAAHGLGIAVHKDFRVAALASLSVGESAILDPPLRSRFQARLVSPVSVGDMLVNASARSRGTLSTTKLKDIVQMAGEIPQGVSLESVHDAVQYLEKHQESITPAAVLNAHCINTTGVMIGVEDILNPLNLYGHDTGSNNAHNFVETETTKAVKDLIIAAFQSGKRAVALVGPKGCYKSAVARNLAYSSGEKIELMSLHPDITDRDLLMTRGTCRESGNTIWKETPLSRAAREGRWVILDGIDRLRSDTLTSLALLMDGLVFLPDGSRFKVNERFRCIAIGLPPKEKSWITPEVRDMFHWIRATPLPRKDVRLLLTKMFPNLEEAILNKILTLQERLDEIVVDSVGDKESLQLTLRKLKHVCRRVEQRPSELSQILHNTLMADFLPDWERAIVEECFSKCGIDVTNNVKSDILCDSFDDLLLSCKRTASNPLLVPNPRFQQNSGQAKVMRDILEAHKVGENALLICGYQGVGKNKIVDYLLKNMNCEREYLQLHRDTTVQSLLLSPSVEHGKVIYHDSPLVRAAKLGRILVLDEADKAPVAVVALLKGLVEDGQLSLPDGRMLQYGENTTADPDIISIHENFSVWALANPASYPFHGNDLSREMSDVFSCHIVPPMDIESHRRILRSYGDNVPPQLIDKIVMIWEDLRVAQQDGCMTYPFSIRESVNVIKHLSLFPNDGIENAVENVISFDRLDGALSKHLDDIFGGHGIKFSHAKSSMKSYGRSEGGVSTPKTRASEPKHGKVDPNNEPHVGKYLPTLLFGSCCFGKYPFEI